MDKLSSLIITSICNDLLDSVDNQHGAIIDVLSLALTNRRLFEIVDRITTKRSLYWKRNEGVDTPGYTPDLTNPTNYLFENNVSFKSIMIPMSITTLVFCDEFNKVITTLQHLTSLNTLILGRGYNKQIKNGILPNSLITLVFGQCYNQVIIPGSLPSSITELVFGEKYNKPFETGTLPSSLMELTLGFKFNQVIKKGDLPSITTLQFGPEYTQMISDGALPSSLTSLIMTENFSNKSVSFGQLPNNIKSFSQANSSVLSYPNSLTELTFGYHYNKVLDISSLTSLKMLKFGRLYDQQILPGMIPTSLTSLSFSPNYHYPIVPGVIPTSVTYLKLGQRFNNTIILRNILPPGLRTLISLPWVATISWDIPQ
ncbi:hypothetical protein SAMD00019534_098210 [Acytostelium subglobosum LB1]|uniref:hypothetical protein n=1 Tax=Acytostelium subglobosum LB1 TaxID=1410327 RepID=UPI000644BDAC|nr:hypothetical protein SAMD00019534_098210 [Acytostelium subglobosum LB1]GAM26646.1 hypothetical protein SAMD00019534_098210 [Acytostelium subglobosum LB1]|eukprot:XP_012750307.1 hypothetical protein SAMD00019534_098210 [Acytostelium subglobosum LB1]